jgi:hypothetical protein
MQFQEQLKFSGDLKSWTLFFDLLQDGHCFPGRILNSTKEHNVASRNSFQLESSSLRASK